MEESEINTIKAQKLPLDVETRYIKNLTNNLSNNTLETMTMAEFKKLYGVKFKPFEFQRDPDEKHIEDIKNYILTTYYRDEFFLPPIIVINLSIINHLDHFEIIDGMHRTLAINAIDDKHICLNKNISIMYLVNPLYDSNIRLKIFKSIGKSKPIADIYIKDDYLKKIHTYVIDKFNSIYGDVVKASDGKTLQATICEDKIKEFLSRNNIILLLKMDKITGINNEEIFHILYQMNLDFEGIIDSFSDCDDILSGKESLVGSDSKLTDKAVNLIVKYLRKINNANQIRAHAVPIILEEIRSNTSYAKPKKLRKKPFLLGLIKTDLFTYYINKEKYLSDMGYTM